jgi:hypothetical protein
MPTEASEYHRDRARESESQRSDWAVTAEEIAGAYSVPHSAPIRECGATLEQVLRMVVYTLEIGYRRIRY